jgi:DNA adenine methylase
MLIRYPGGKSKLKNQIKKLFPEEMLLHLWANHARWSYHEPFLGSGEMAFSIIQDEILPFSSRIILSDIDYHLICLWKSILHAPKELCELVEEFIPSAEIFYKYKEMDNVRNIEPVQAGFQKLALHQMSFSGLGYMAGGPLGGKSQSSSKYLVNCRWNPAVLCHKIMVLHKALSRYPNLTIACRSFEWNLKQATAKSFCYLDPPYYVKGPELYRYSMDQNAHCKLADLLKNTASSWALSYDDAPEVKQLYDGWTSINSIDAKYSIWSGEKGKPKNKEILIMSFPREACKSA